MRTLIPTFDRTLEELDAIAAHLQSVIQEPGQPLPVGVRQRMEALLDAEFSGVVLHTSPQAAALCQKFPARAIAFGDHILFSQGSYEPLREQHFGRGLNLLAHELAHVVQQRLGREHRRSHARSTAEFGAIELEADIAAAHVSAGHPYRCIIADSRNLPAAWGLAGHYYTPYLVFLNAGVHAEVARRLATWCWLPDQVSELDAATVGINDIGFPSNQTNEVSNRRNYRRMFETLCEDRFRGHEQYVRVVHKGLHTLTGGNALQETEYRKEVFLKPLRGLLFKGLALHAFGDAYAHRRFPGGFFGGGLPGSGQTVAGPGEDGMTLYSPGGGHWSAGDSADEPWNKHRGVLFVAYVHNLSKLALAHADRPSPRFDINEIVAALTPIIGGLTQIEGGPYKGFKQIPGYGLSWDAIKTSRSGKGDTIMKLAAAEPVLTQDGCGDHIARVAREVLGSDMRVIKEADPRPWEVYCSSAVHADSGLATLHADSGGYSTNDYIFFKILQHAVLWSKETLANGTPLRPIDGPRPRRVS